MQPEAVLVMSTIADPVILEDYFRNFERFGYLDRTVAIVIPDRKTPAAAYDRCRDLTRRGLKTFCPTLDEQEIYLNKFNGLGKLIPYNSDNRRNVGFLFALESGAPVMLSIDDDNWCLPDEDFVKAHSIVLGEPTAECEVSSENRWFNICDMLETEPHVTVYPRGFPYFARHQQPRISRAVEKGRVHMNAGLWLSEPDMDAMTWLIAPVRASAMRGSSVLLSDSAWSPINTQNTAVHRDVIISYYFLRMGYPLAGTPIDRYGDIFSGYFSQACVRHLGYKLRVGSPLAEHRRNSHNYMRDAANEFACIWALEDITQWLVDTKLEGSNYGDAYASLADKLEDAVEGFSGTIWNQATRGYFHQTAYLMRRWIAACRMIS
ncbi:MAG TPA: hypothetical protein VFQ24_04085 [Terriglobia bacterium]|nr:hypothetical protein [Terriglobia bacterium]